MHFLFFKKHVFSTTFILFFCFTAHTQNYVDILKINYGNVFGAGYENSNTTTDVQLLDFSLLYPIKLNEKTAIISGLDYTQQNLSLFPSNNETTSLTNLTFKAGLSIKHSKKVSGTYVLLPRISSEKLHTKGNHFFFGGIALIKYQKTEKFQWRFGAYGSSEGFGVLVTPIIGLHYLSTNKRLEITANLPINADINYTLGKTTSLGFGFQAPVKSYSLKPEVTPKFYVQVSNIEFGPYFETRILNNSLLLRLQGGYSTVSYEVFEEGDTLPFRLSAVEFGDNRNLVNSEMSGNIFARFGLIYRFHLNKK